MSCSKVAVVGLLLALGACTQKKPATIGVGASDDAPTPTETDAGGSAPLNAAQAAASAASGCVRFDPKKVYVYGSIGGPSAQSTFADPTDPAHVCTSILEASSLMIRPRDGAIVYAAHAFKTSGSDGFADVPQAIRSFTQDAFLSPPAYATVTANGDAYKNDGEISASCPVELGAVLIRPDDSAVTYNCVGMNFVESVAFGTPQEVLAQGYAGHSLAHIGSSGLVILPGKTAVSLPAGFGLVCARALQDGFWLAIQNTDLKVEQLMKVDFAGKTTMLGEYDALPSPYRSDLGAIVIAGDGHLWQVGEIFTPGTPAPTAAAVLDRPLKPDQTRVVYSSDRYQSDLTSTPPRIFVDLTNFPTLFTGP